MTHLFLMMGVGLTATCLLMLVVWIVSRVIDNAGIVDIAWALGFTLAAVVYALIGHATNVRQWTVIIMVLLWSLRLAWHLALRFKRWYPKEDPRYAALKEKMGKDADRKMLIVFLWQATMLTLMSAPLAVAIADRRSDFSFLQFFGIGVWLIALCGEALADYQLTTFTSEPANQGRTCQQGLWYYSRHPNYFFEWLGSVAFFLYASSSPYGIWTIICPLIFLHLLINISGVKPSEEQSLQSRSDYAYYKKRTSVFVPWFRRNIS